MKVLQKPIRVGLLSILCGFIISTPGLHAQEFKAISAVIDTGTGVVLIEQGKESDAKLILRNTGPQAAKLDIHGKWKPLEGDEVEWQGGQIEVPAGGESAMALNPKLDQTGWWQFTPELRSGEKRYALRPISVAYIEPTGARTPAERTGDFLFGAGGSAGDRRAAEAARRIGIDWTRLGADRRKLEPAKGKFDWSDFEKQIQMAEEFGLWAQVLVAYGPDWAAREGYPKKIGNEQRPAWTAPPNTDHWKVFLSEFVGRYAGRIQVYEIWNEPDLIGFWHGTTDEYLELLANSAEVIRELDPKAKVGTGGIATLGPHGGHGHNPDMTERIALEGYPSWDVFIDHEHGDFPYFEGILNGRLRPLLDKVPGMEEHEVWFNETASPAAPNVDAWHKQAASLVKKISLAHQWGAKAYSWFYMFRDNEPPTDFGLLDRGERREDPLQPKPAFAAYNQLIKLLRGKAESRRVPVGTEQDWLLQFTDGADESLLVFWTQQPGAGEDPLLIRIPQGIDAIPLDFMGNSLAHEKHGDVLAVRMQGTPGYVLFRGSAEFPEVTGRLVEIAKLPPVRPGQTLQGSVKLRNPLTDPATFKLGWRIPGAPLEQKNVEVPAGGTQQFAIEVQVPERIRGDSPALMVEYMIEGTDWRGRLMEALETAVLVPAEHSPNRAPDFTLQSEDQVENFHRFDPDREHMTWQGPQDLSAKVWLQLQDDALVVKIDVSDDKHDQSHEAGNLWRGDSVQLAIAGPSHDTIRGGYWELLLAHTNDGKDHIYPSGRPSDVPDADVNSFELATSPRQGGRIYDLVLPLKSLGLTEDELRSGIRFSLLVNDDDGEGRLGYIQLSDGIGKEKSAEHFPLVQFEK